MLIALADADVDTSYGRVHIKKGELLHDEHHELATKFPGLWRKQRAVSRADHARAAMLADPDGGFTSSGRGKSVSTRTAAVADRRSAPSRPSDDEPPEAAIVTQRIAWEREDWERMHATRAATPTTPPADLAPGQLPEPSNTVRPAPRSDAYLAAWEPEYRDLLRFARQHSHAETGGHLYGVLEHRRYRIVHVVGPGPGAVHERAYYRPDVQHDHAVYEQMQAAGWRWLGSWHTEPSESRGELSREDRDFWTGQRERYHARNYLGLIVVRTEGSFRTFVYELAAGASRDSCRYLTVL
jgi:hypothetical protein